MGIENNFQLVLSSDELDKRTYLIGYLRLLGPSRRYEQASLFLPRSISCTIDAWEMVGTDICNSFVLLFFSLES